MIDNITNLRKVQMELLKAFSDVCKTHDLKWYAFFGTLLGISRNEGYLPWDDDVDVVMPLEDYRTLCAHGEWFDTSKFTLQTPQDHAAVRFAHLRKNGTTEFREDFIECLK
ncbi:MAG: LicD family protein, partial [Lachnospiraceae bacterium]|nr:LicD family protein [Lachnospiraceae bacterium]